jgi:hypothetical protein
VRSCQLGRSPPLIRNKSEFVTDRDHTIAGPLARRVCLIDLSEPLKRATKDHLSHIDHVETLLECRQLIALAVERANGPVGEKLKHAAKQIHCRHSLQAISEVTEAAVTVLTSGCWTAAEALSRIAIEHSVNMIYVLADSDGGRVRSLLKYYIDDSIRRANNWLKSSEQKNHANGIEAAQLKLHYLQELKISNDSWYGVAKGWPDARRRFEETGLGHQYHVLFATASDSVHGLAEDVFNLVAVNKLPEGVQSEGKDAISAERASFAVYLVTNSLLFYCEAVHYLADALGDVAAMEAVKRVGAKLRTVIDEHERMADLYRDARGGSRELSSC